MRILYNITIFLLILISTVASENPEPDSACGEYTHVAVSTDVPVCSKIGSGTLENGGSVVDSAIATMLCLGVVHPHSSGIGGGVSLVLYDSPTGEVIALNSREVAPSYSSRDMFSNDPEGQYMGALSIGLMGEVKAAWELWEVYGELPWRELFQPAIQLARDGVNVTWALADAIATEEEAIKSDPGLSKHFLKEDGSILLEGDVVYQETLADTFQLIAEEGWSTFYNGTVAQNIADDIQDLGGNLTVSELGNFTVQWRSPEVTYLPNGEFTVYGVQLPIAGLGQGFFLKLMDKYNLTPEDLEFDDPSLLYHRISEGLKFAIGRAMVLGDDSPEFNSPEMEQLVELLRSDDYNEEIWNLIDDDNVYDLEYYKIDPSVKGYKLPPPGSTTHFNIMGQDGSAIAVTNTVGHFFGSKILGVRSGVVFNNGMYNFYTPEMTNVPFNYIAPGKRPRSYVGPTLVADGTGEIVMSAGGSGSLRIFTGTSQVVLRSLWLTPDNLKSVADNGRVHHEMDVDELYYDDTIEQEVLDGLQSRGHNLVPMHDRYPYSGVVQSNRLVKTKSAKQACSDYRKQGAPWGY